MKNFLRKYGLVLFLVVLALGLTIIKVEFGYKGGPIETVQTIQPSPTTEITPAATPTIDDGYSLTPLLPYSGKGFVIDRYLGPKKLLIILKGGDKQTVIKEVAAWLTANNTDFSGYILEFSTAK